MTKPKTTNYRRMNKNYLSIIQNLLARSPSSFCHQNADFIYAVYHLQKKLKHLENQSALHAYIPNAVNAKYPIPNTALGNENRINVYICFRLLQFQNGGISMELCTVQNIHKSKKCISFPSGCRERAQWCYFQVQREFMLPDTYTHIKYTQTLCAMAYIYQGNSIMMIIYSFTHRKIAADQMHSTIGFVIPVQQCRESQAI